MLLFTQILFHSAHLQRPIALVLYVIFFLLPERLICLTCPLICILSFLSSTLVFTEEILCVCFSSQCCDHPYLVDPSVQKLLIKDLQVVQYLDVGIKACGKLQLLDKLLFELQNRGLRSLIMFQVSLSSEYSDQITQINISTSQSTIMSRKRCTSQKFIFDLLNFFITLLQSFWLLVGIHTCV